MAKARSARSGGALKARSKVWLERDGRAVFGDGRLQWLELVDELGSLKAVAESLGMSYRGLWGRFRQTERRLGLALLVRQTGGRGGGGTRLTEQGRQFLCAYRRFRKGIDEIVDRRFVRMLGRLEAILSGPPRRKGRQAKGP